MMSIVFRNGDDTKVQKSSWENSKYEKNNNQFFFIFIFLYQRQTGIAIKMIMNRKEKKNVFNNLKSTYHFQPSSISHGGAKYVYVFFSTTKDSPSSVDPMKTYIKCVQRWFASTKSFRADFTEHTEVWDVTHTVLAFLYRLDRRRRRRHRRVQTSWSVAPATAPSVAIKRRLVLRKKKEREN
jgi:hypothetical protein